MFRNAIVLLCLALLQPLAFAATSCSNRIGEDFSRFAERFAADRPFSQSRTLYPLSLKRAEYGGDDVKYVETQRSALEDSHLPRLNELRTGKGLVSRVADLTVESATIELTKPDIDLLIAYHFERRTGCWYLKQIEDLSL